MQEIKYYCDRCKKEIKGPYIPLVKVLDYDVGDVFQDINLCKPCLNHFYNFLNKKILSYSDIVKED